MDISVIGTGNMGSAIASGLMDAGRRLTVFNRTPEKTRPLAERGAAVAESAADAIAASDLTIVVLLDAESTRSVLLADATRPSLEGRSLISAAAMSPEEALSIAGDVAAAGGAYSEVAIATYPEQVRARRSEFIIACAPGHADRWRDVFTQLGPRVHDVGEVGNASRAQMSLWLSYMFMTIAMTYPVAAFEKLGLPMDVARTMLTDNPTLAITGAGGIVPEMIRREYGSGSWTVDNMILSMDQAMGFADRLGLDTGVMRAIRGVYARASSMGLGGRDVSAVYEAVNPSA